MAIVDVATLKPRVTRDLLLMANCYEKFNPAQKPSQVDEFNVEFGFMINNNIVKILNFASSIHYDDII
jgi:hypothetical protein